MRVYAIILDSLGCGNAPDAALFGDEGSNTIKALYDTGRLKVPELCRLGLFNIDGMDYAPELRCKNPVGSFCRLTEKSGAKDTTVGHWELAGLVTEKPFPVFPDGFPEEVISEFERQTGYGTLLNKPYSGTDAIRDYGEEHVRTGKLIVYTSADSVFQIAAHEDVVPVEKLYEICRIARGILKGKYGVGRVIARPFVGNYPDYKRTANRHDFSLEPPSDTCLDILKAKGRDVISVGKIVDIFAGRGITEYYRTTSNAMGMEKTIELADKDFDGLCFVNLVDFDSMYGHRNDVQGYTDALNEFDTYLQKLLPKLRSGDLLMLSADHGCDPITPSTDHSRERVPLIMYSPDMNGGINYGTRDTFADFAATILAYLGVENRGTGINILG